MAMSPANPPSNFPEGLPNMNFSNVGGAIAGQPVLTTIYDLAPWNTLREVFLRHGMAPSFRQILRAMGGPFSRGVAAPTSAHYEEDWDESLIHIGSIVTAASGAGGTMVVALDAASMFNTAVTVGGAARQASYPQPNMRLMLPDGNMAIIQSKDVTTNPHRLTLKPILAAVNLNTSVTAGEKYFSPDNAWGEGTNLPIGKLKRLFKYTNTFQIVKAAFGASGSSMTMEFYPTFERVGENIMMVLEAQTMREYESDISGALLFGQQMDNISTTDTAMGYDVAVSGTEGLITFALNNGYTDTYTPGSYTTQDLYTVARLYQQEMLGVNQIVTWDGFDLYAEREQALGTLFQYTLAPKMVASFVNASGPELLNDGWQPNNDEDFIAWLGFKGAHVAGYNFLFRTLHEFNSAIGAGADAYDYMKWSIYLPLGETKDVRNNQPRSYFGYEWRQLGNYKRENVIATIAGAGVGGTNGYFNIQYVASEYDYAKCGIVSEIAFHAACGNRIVIQQPA